MSTERNELIRIKEELENSKDIGSTNVRLRNDVHKIVTIRAKKEDKSIVKFVTIAVIEKLLR